MDVPKTPAEQPKAPETPTAPATLVLPTIYWVYAIVPLIFLIAFHVGAGYLSFQKYGNIAWAFLDFLFAYFYYPYYAFFLAKDPGPSVGMIGGRKPLAKVLFGKLLK